MYYTYNSKGKLIDRDSSKKTTEKSSKSSSSASSSNKTSSSSSASGYGEGTGYTNRETAFRWSDGTITYSNATSYKDAATAAGKDLSRVGLVSATTYGTGSLTGNSNNYGVTAVGDGSGKSGFTTQIKSSNEGNKSAYEMAMMQADYLSGLYGYDYSIGSSKSGNAYQKGSVSSLLGTGAGMQSDMDWQKVYDKAAKSQAKSIQAKTDAVINNLNSNREDYERQFDEIARQAYIANRQAQTALPQQMATLGLTGGARETSMLKLSSNYENLINDNETNRLYMNKDIDTQISNAQLSADSDIASMKSEYYLSAMQAYQNQINQQNSLYMDMLDYGLQKDKLNQQSYYNDLDHQLELQKLNASADADEYDRLADKAVTLGKYGVFSEYSKLGYSADEISAMTAAYIAQNTPKAKTVVYKSSSSKGSSSKNSKATSDKSYVSGAVSSNQMGTDYLRNVIQSRFGYSF